MSEYNIAAKSQDEQVHILRFSVLFIRHSGR